MIALSQECIIKYICLHQNVKTSYICLWEIILKKIRIFEKLLKTFRKLPAVRYGMQQNISFPQNFYLIILVFLTFLFRITVCIHDCKGTISDFAPSSIPGCYHNQTCGKSLGNCNCFQQHTSHRLRTNVLE